MVVLVESCEKYLPSYMKAYDEYRQNDVLSVSGHEYKAAYHFAK